MKKVILIFAALLLVASGVAAVSAYEAHVINVKAHVENALKVQTDNLDFGTVFPQEFLKYHRDIQLSPSAVEELGVEEGDLDCVNVTLFVEWKELADNPFAYEDPPGSGNWTSSTGYYNWMGYFMWLGIDCEQPEGNETANMAKVGPPLAGPPSAQTSGFSRLICDNETYTIGIAICAPVFEDYYNDLTDPLPKPGGLMAPSWEIPKDMPGYDPTGGMDFGIDLKVQVTDIIRH